MSVQYLAGLPPRLWDHADAATLTRLVGFTRSTTSTTTEDRTRITRWRCSSTRRGTSTRSTWISATWWASPVTTGTGMYRVCQEVMSSTFSLFLTDLSNLKELLIGNTQFYTLRCCRYSKGMNRRTGRTGLFPSYKVRENIDIVKFPTYPEVPISNPNRTWRHDSEVPISNPNRTWRQDPENHHQP